MLKFRASLGVSAVANNVKSSGLSLPPSPSSINLTSLRVGATSLFSIVHVASSPGESVIVPSAAQSPPHTDAV